ncbi:MAG TPA: right-handed parallel beta-helix repeat-containing protein [bacterium]|jgi:hypothetical protein
MMRLISLFILTILVMSATALADTTWVAGGSAVSGQWSDVGSPYIIQGDIHIAPFDTLKVGPDVLVFFDRLGRFTVEGVLLVSGTPGAEVCFTADTLANTLSWGGIRLISPTGVSQFAHAIIQYGHALASGEFGFGGGIYCNGANIVMNNCTVRWCRATSGQGIYLSNHSTATLAECTIRENGSPDGLGGGFYLRNGCTATLADCYVSRNQALYGGGMSVDASTVTLTRCHISKNNAVVSGGGLFCSTASVVNASNCLFLANSSMGGGAMDGRFEVNLLMDHCLIESNIAMRQGGEGPGGGLAFAGGHQRVTNCTFVNNAAGQGGAVWAGANTVLENCIFAFQVAGGGVRFPYAGSTLQFCCFANNEDGDITGTLGPIGVGGVAYTNANGDSCDRYQNLFLNPRFDGSATQAYHLAAGSPCINSGSPVTAHDPDGTIADMGAYYYDGLRADEPVTLHPSSFALSSYPNPFNPSTSLHYDLAHSGPVSLRIFDLMGRQVAVLENGPRLAGSYTVTWDASSQPSGSYFAVLESAGLHRTQKLLLLK